MSVIAAAIVGAIVGAIVSVYAALRWWLRIGKGPWL